MPFEPSANEKVIIIFLISKVSLRFSSPGGFPKGVKTVRKGTKKFLRLLTMKQTTIRVDLPGLAVRDEVPEENTSE